MRGASRGPASAASGKRRRRRRYCRGGALWVTPSPQPGSPPWPASVLSGLLTTEHGVRLREPRIPIEVALVAEHLQSAGYRTAAITTNAYLVEGAGFARGFEIFEYTRDDSEVVTRRALDWLDEIGDEDPFFLYRERPA